ncbi:MAG TPA: glycosyltransferase family 87 protein [Anaerolineae bacterium]
MNYRHKRAVIVGLGLVLLFALMVYATHEVFTSRFAGANDLYPRWKGAQLFWQEGIDPYSAQATEAIQTGIYGRLARSDEDQVLFVYPFYTVFLLWPLIELPYSWVQAIWLVTLQFALIAAIILCLRLIEWRMPAWLLALTLLWAVVFYHSTRTIILGQFAGLIFLWLAGSLLALKHGRDALAGTLLALTTIKPQMSFLVIPALLLWAIGQRRWRFVGAFAAATAILAGVSFLLLPSWLTSFTEQVAFYPDYTFTGSPLWVITGYYFPQLGKPVETALSILLLFYLFYQWRDLPRHSIASPQFLIIVGLTLIVTNTIVVRTATTNYVVLYIPLFLLLKGAADSLPYGNGWAATFYVLSTTGTWTLFLTTIQGDLEHPVMYLPLPLALLVILAWARITWTRSSEAKATGLVNDTL